MNNRALYCIAMRGRAAMRCDALIALHFECAVTAPNRTEPNRIADDGDVSRLVWSRLVSSPLAYVRYIFDVLRVTQLNSTPLHSIESVSRNESELN